jgi:hypothetical protein
MVQIGTAPGSSNIAQIIVSENHPGTMLIIGADTGAPDGPGRKIDVFEDVQVHGNLSVGELNAVRARFPQGIDGSINQGVDDEVPRIEKLAGDERLHIIGGGPLGGPGRDVVLWDDVRVTNDLVVANDATVTQNATVAGNLTVNNAVTVGTTLTVNGTGPHTFGGDIDASPGSDLNLGDAATGWGQVKAENAVYAAGVFHLYDRGGGPVIDLKCGFGWDAVPAFFGTSNFPPLAGLPLVMLVLDAPIDCATTVVTPWVLGEYDETTPSNPVIIAVEPSCPAVQPHIVHKGFPPAPTGSNPTDTSCPIQQIEIVFFDAACSPFTPSPPASPIDLVFDVKVCGCECTP